MKTGAIMGSCFEIDGMITAYRKKYKELTVFIAGGDSEYLGKHLENTHITEPHMALKGLNKILKFNVINANWIRFYLPVLRNCAYHLRAGYV
ncbi:MAG: hypothetical protein M3Q97_08390, partial [Bacteroidota bacterium]|nr:hypothetical protein [Bacteroidota bacterium]